ncbi:MAG: hypothetical protein L6V93_06525 [Clostridiales bacterium]|nr:MAG: hypothetical protein L6V93_06525 [Clostridiales bacterium]
MPARPDLSPVVIAFTTPASSPSRFFYCCFSIILSRKNAEKAQKSPALFLKFRFFSLGAKTVRKKRLLL